MTTAIREINKYVNLLSDDEQEQLAEALRKRLLIGDANRLSRKTLSKKIPISEIVKEVRIVRKQRYARQSGR